MKTYTEINVLISQWKAEGLSKGEIIRRTAEACIGWPYVWGGYGQFCTPANRKAYADRGSCSTAEAEQIRKKCPVLNGKKAACAECKYYPGGRVRFFDCRGFTRWLMLQAGLSLKGAGATSQWNDASNWAQKGGVAEMPKDRVCCVFMRDGTKMSHTGMHVGNGVVIHCSGEVKQGKITDKGWTHYAVPAGMAGETPQSAPEPQPEVKRSADAVRDDEAFALWPQVLSELSQLNMAMWGVLTGSSAFERGDFILIKSDNDTVSSFIRIGKNARDVKEAIERVTGRRYRLGIYSRPAAPEKQPEQKQDPLEDLLQKAQQLGVLQE